MNLIVADAEFKNSLANTTDEIEAIESIGKQFLALLDKLKRMGYKSEAMEAAISEKQEIVKNSLEVLTSASEPLSSSISSFVDVINDIDHL